MYFSKIVYNYEVREGNLLKCSSVINHASEEKENIDHHGTGQAITNTTVTRAVNEVFQNKVRKYRSQREGERSWFFCNLLRKSHQPNVQIKNSEDWNFVQASILSLSNTIGSNWRIVTNDETITFLHCENVRIDNHIVVCELTLRKTSNGRINTSIRYHERRVPENLVNDMLNTFPSGCS